MRSDLLANDLNFSIFLKRQPDKDPVDTGRKLNVHKTFRRRSGGLLNVLCTFSLHPVPMGNIITTMKDAVKGLENKRLIQFMPKYVLLFKFPNLLRMSGNH